MTKIPFHQYTPRQHGLRSLEEAISEIQREMDVRKRLFDRWVQEGKLSYTDARDRLERHMSALKFLLAYDKEQSDLNDERSNDISTPLSSIPQIPVDTEPAQQAA